jgi:hypothetical protein
MYVEIDSLLAPVKDDTVGCNDLPVFRRPVRRNPEMIYNRPYEGWLGDSAEAVYRDHRREADACHSSVSRSCHS